METKRVSVAGATGYLGQYIVKELKQRNYWFRVLIRHKSQKSKFKDVDDFYVGEITKPETLQGVCIEIDWVFSTVGITRQKDGLTYMDVDYQGNSNLLEEAKKSDVEQFQYISAINGEHLRQLKIFAKRVIIALNIVLGRLFSNKHKYLMMDILFILKGKSALLIFQKTVAHVLQFVPL